jgi:hypothetical protein
MGRTQWRFGALQTFRPRAAKVSFEPRKTDAARRPKVSEARQAHFTKLQLMKI